jgi:hypothetical protein
VVAIVDKEMEAAIGFEPMNEGFADLCLSHLATPPWKRTLQNRGDAFLREFRTGNKIRETVG